MKIDKLEIGILESAICKKSKNALLKTRLLLNANTIFKTFKLLNSIQLAISSNYEKHFQHAIASVKKLFACQMFKQELKRKNTFDNNFRMF